MRPGLLISRRDQSWFHVSDVTETRLFIYCQKQRESVWFFLFCALSNCFFGLFLFMYFLFVFH